MIKYDDEFHKAGIVVFKHIKQKYEKKIEKMQCLRLAPKSQSQAAGKRI